VSKNKEKRCDLRPVVVARRATIDYVTFQLSTNGGAMADGAGNFALVMPSIKQGFNLMTIFLTALGIFARTNTNITRLAEPCGARPARLNFRVALTT
jgi:hypothetical protein